MGLTSSSTYWSFHDDQLGMDGHERQMEVQRIPDPGEHVGSQWGRFGNADRFDVYTVSVQGRPPVKGFARDAVERVRHVQCHVGPVLHGHREAFVIRTMHHGRGHREARRLRIAHRDLFARP